MAIQIKSPSEIDEMRSSCSLAARVLDFINPHVVAGVTTDALNKLCHNYIVDNKAYPSPLNYRGSYPKSICSSVNSVVCHGIPDDTVLCEGDIVNLDITTFLNGYHGDTSKTFFVGKCSRAARDLVAHTEKAMWEGIKAVKPGGNFGDIGAAIAAYILPKGYSIVEEYCGHGIGKNFHEDPHVPHNAKAGTGPMIKAGMVFTIEPMINVGSREVVLWDDGWTVETSDRKLSAQFEHTIAVFENRVEVLTLRQDAIENPIVWQT